MKNVLTPLSAVALFLLCLQPIQLFKGASVVQSPTELEVKAPEVAQAIVVKAVDQAPELAKETELSSPQVNQQPLRRRQQRNDQQARLYRGMASFYADRFHGRPTASGEIYDQFGFTAAHPDLPHGTRVRVRNLRNGRSVVVRINDRGPFYRGRIIDLSFRAAEELRLIRQGVGMVELEVIKH